MLPAMTTSNHQHHHRQHHPVHRPASSGRSGIVRTYVSGFFSWTASVTLVFFALILTPDLRSGSGGVNALSCGTCDFSLCPSTSGCPGGLVLDICRCCQVCARLENQKCGGMFGILGKCDRNLHCFLRPVDGQPVTGEEEGICKEIQEPLCNDDNCPPVYEPRLCPPDSYLATSGSKRQDSGSVNDVDHNNDYVYQSNEASSDNNNFYLLPEQTSYCVCNTSVCDLPVCTSGYNLQLVHNATGLPGECCNMYVCNMSEACQSVICPPVEETQCPEDSTRLPSKWTEDNCCELQQECTCSSDDQCEPVWCPPGFQVQVTSRATMRPGSCCDRFRCVNESGMTCTYNGKELKNGETWHIDKCKTCECRGGLNRCKDKSCKNLSCTWMVIPENECCPVCRGCVSDSGELYNESAVWKENDCTTCTCKDGHAQCQAEMCAVHCANPRNVPGQCCPVCSDEEPVSTSSMCPSLESCSLECKHGLDQTYEKCPLCRCREELCHLDCQFGLKADVEGNTVCECRGADDRCSSWEEEHCEKKCEYGYKRSRHGCVKCKCKKCPQFNCTKRCIHGHILNDEGCPLCKCKDMAVPELTNANSEPENIEGRACMSWHGSRHENGESWNDGCRECYCHNGVEMCSLIACPAPQCSNPVFRTGDCCPTCPGLTVMSSEGDKELCASSQGHYYVEGETWEMDPCIHCICHAGTILCEVPSCPPVLCHHPVKKEGDCCATCRGDDLHLAVTRNHYHHCTSPTGVLYKHLEVWRSTACQSCVCQDGQIHCYNQMCPPLTCDRTLLRKGQCCPTCLDSNLPKVCVYSGVTYESGEKWEGNNCSQCLCSGGKTECFPMSCPHLECNVLIRKRGQCCPECYDLSQKNGGMGAYNDRNLTNNTELSENKSTMTGNIVGFAVLGILVFLLAVTVALLVLCLLTRKYHSKFRQLPKSTNLELQGQMPFIPDQHTKIVNSEKQYLETEKQYLEKLCPGIASEKGKGNRTSNDYTEMVFKDQTKEALRDSGEHYLPCVKS